MTSATLPLSGRTRFSAVTALGAGLAAGALDIFILAPGIQVLARGHLDFVRILHSVASGLFGPAAREGGLPMAAAGLFLHFTIATIWAFIFATVYSRSAVLRQWTSTPRGRVMVGLAYGVVIWLGMNLVVVPLSRATSNLQFTMYSALMIVGHALLIGLPISLIVSSGARERS